MQGVDGLRFSSGTYCRGRCDLAQTAFEARARREGNVDVTVKRFSPGYKLACVCDALALPVLFVLWYRWTYAADAGAMHHEEHHAGLFVSTVLMIIVARAVLRIERALRAPEIYRWDLERAFRWLVVLIAMALAIRLLR
jgi:hypothetical protein